MATSSFHSLNKFARPTFSKGFYVIISLRYRRTLDDSTRQRRAEVVPMYVLSGF